MPLYFIIIGADTSNKKVEKIPVNWNMCLTPMHGTHTMRHVTKMLIKYFISLEQFIIKQTRFLITQHTQSTRKHPHRPVSGYLCEINLVYRNSFGFSPQTLIFLLISEPEDINKFHVLVTGSTYLPNVGWSSSQQVTGLCRDHARWSP